MKDLQSKVFKKLGNAMLHNVLPIDDSANKIALIIGVKQSNLPLTNLT
jgi:hypothetical protein